MNKRKIWQNMLIVISCVSCVSFLLSSSVYSKRLHFGIISAINEKINELKEGVNKLKGKQLPIEGETSEIIGPSGGTVEVTNSSSPLYRAKVEIPVGALSANTNISINIQIAEPSFPTYLKKASEMVSLSPDGTLFNVPVTISIPYNPNNVTDQNMLGVYAYDEETSSWTILTLSDMSNGVTKALTQHFSSFQVAEYINPLSNDGDTGFKPSINGFSIDNFTDIKDPGGHCWGMVAFAAWYWGYKQTDVNLLAKYSECEARSVVDETTHNIAEIRPDFIHWKLYQNAAYVANALMIGIDLEKPQLLSLFINNPPGHAVLSYKYVKNSDSKVTFYIYDPNYPLHDDRTITYENGKFKPYDSYNEYQIVGGLYSLSSYETIYQLEMLPNVPELELISAPTVAPVDVITPVYLYFRGCNIVTFHDVDISPSGVVSDQYFTNSLLLQEQVSGKPEGSLTWYLGPTSGSERGINTKRYSLIDAKKNESNVITFQILVP